MLLNHLCNFTQWLCCSISTVAFCFVISINTFLLCVCHFCWTMCQLFKLHFLFLVLLSSTELSILFAWKNMFLRSYYIPSSEPAVREVGMNNVVSALKMFMIYNNGSPRVPGMETQNSSCSLQIPLNIGIVYWNKANTRTFYDKPDMILYLSLA